MNDSAEPRGTRRALALVLCCAFAGLVAGAGATAGQRVLAQGTACGPHTSYAQACPIGEGAFSDTTPAGKASFYSVQLPTDGRALQVVLQNATGVQAALIRDANGVTGPVEGGVVAARPPYAADDGGPVRTDDSALATPSQTIPPFPAPFQDTPFQDTPFQDTPFQDTPFQDTAQSPRFAPIQVVAAADAAPETKTLTHFVDALDAPEFRTPILTLAVWSADGAGHGYSVAISYPAPAQTCRPGAVTEPPLTSATPVAGSANPRAPEGVTTLILTSETQWERYFGPDGRSTVMSELRRLAQSPQVNGAVLSVDADQATAQAYDAWNANQCSATLANAVAARNKRLVQRYLAAHRSIRYLVIAGADPIVPFFRVPDGAHVAPELSYAGQTGLDANSAAAASFSADELLTDDYYADPHGELSGPRILFTPALPVGRLVERPSDVTAEVEMFIASGGVLQGNAGLVTGYDFLQQTATDVAGILQAGLPSIIGLNSDDWSAADLSGALDGAPDLLFFSGHFVHDALQTGVHDIFRATAISSRAALMGKLFFSLGCHSGASIPDAFADPSTGIGTDDWAESIAALGGTLIGNTGYGYGDSDLPAYGQELMTDLAGYLVAPVPSGAVAIGDALLAAKQLYRARNDGKWDAYHAKTLMESALYGLPMYALALSGAGTPPQGPPPLPVAPAAGAAYRSVRAGQNVVHAEVDVPVLNRVEAASGDGSYFTTSEGVDVRAFQPVQPQLTFAVPPQQGAVLHGVVVTGGSYATLSDFDPVIVRPVWDQSAFEPQFDYRLPMPASLTALNGRAGANGALQQHLVVTAGRFQSTTTVPAGDPNDAANPYVGRGVAFPHTTGTERLYRHLSLDLFYSADANWNPPAVSAVQITCAAPGTAAVRTTVSGPQELSRVLLAVEHAGLLSTTGLAGAGATWSGTVALDGPPDGLTLEAIDAGGNAVSLPLALPAGIAGGCRTPGGLGSTATPQPGTANRPHGSIRINGAGADPQFPPGTNTALLLGSWDSGGASCANGNWLLAFYTAPAGAIIPGTAQPTTVMPAPCNSGGAPAPWRIDLPNAVGARVCAGVVLGSTVALQAVDAFDCVNIPATPVFIPAPPAPAPNPTPVVRPRTNT